MNRNRSLALLLALLASAVVASGCPKDGGTSTPTPVPSATQVADATAGSDTSRSTPTPVPSAAPLKDGQAWTIGYRWSGGLSIYHHYEMSITGAETAKVVFKVKPTRQDEVTVEDTLSADEFAELKGLFAAVDFDKVGTQKRRVRIMDIGQTVISREIAGGSKHEITENPNDQAASDIRPLKSWFDGRVRAYLDKAGVAPKKRGDVSPTPTPAP